MRRWTRRFGLVIASTFITLAGAELSTRAAGCAPDLQRIDPTSESSVYHPSDKPALGYELKRTWRDDHADLHRFSPSSHSLGFRDRERRPEKPAGVRRIVVLADSVVAQHGIALKEDMIPAQMERSSPGSEVWNLAVGGYLKRSVERKMGA